MRAFNDAVDQFRNYVLSLLPRQVTTVLGQQIAAVNYLLPPRIEPEQQPGPRYDTSFNTNNGLWEAVIDRKVRSEGRMLLDSFFLFEWLPRSPGRYTTSSARMARHTAMRDVEAVEDRMIILNPSGKSSMLDGGVGNIRLKSIHVNGKELYLMSASSSGDCHEGFPVALTPEMYNKYIDEIANKGATVVNLLGKLKFLPEDNALSNIYSEYEYVPQLYLEVEEIKPPDHPQSRRMAELRVSVAVSFWGEWKGEQGVYASFVTFDPTDPLAFDSAVQWMEQDYVVKRYNGKVLTDFDQQERHFADAPFSYTKIMNFDVDWEAASQSGVGTMIPIARLRNAVETVQQKIVLNNPRINTGVNVERGDYVAGDKFINKDNVKVGAQGTVNATGITVEGNVITSTATTENLSDQLTRLLTEARKEASAPDQKLAVGAIDAAVDAVKKGDEVAAHGFLKLAGKWGYDLAVKITADLAAEVIKKQIGL